jgi:hypothetical protein
VLIAPPQFLPYHPLGRNGIKKTGSKAGFATGSSVTFPPQEGGMSDQLFSHGIVAAKDSRIIQLLNSNINPP